MNLRPWQVMSRTGNFWPSEWVNALCGSQVIIQYCIKFEICSEGELTLLSGLCRRDHIQGAQVCIPVCVCVCVCTYMCVFCVHGSVWREIYVMRIFTSYSIICFTSVWPTAHIQKKCFQGIVMIELHLSKLFIFLPFWCDGDDVWGWLVSCWCHVGVWSSEHEFGLRYLCLIRREIRILYCTSMCTVHCCLSVCMHFCRCVVIL